MGGARLRRAGVASHKANRACAGAGKDATTTTAEVDVLFDNSGTGIADGTDNGGCSDDTMGRCELVEVFVEDVITLFARASFT